MTIQEKALAYHEAKKGKLEVTSTVEINSMEDMSLAYTPGVAQPCREIHKNPELAYKYTRKWNLVAVVTDGTAVLGLGDIGPLAGMPVMEGKAVLFKQFGGVDAFPICLDTKDTEEIIKTVKYLSPTFGGINLEDIAAPRCFEIERRLQEELDIPVFHDDQHGTAIVVLAALLNALKVVKKRLDNVKVVINGAGSAGISIGKLLLRAGLSSLILCDKDGALYAGKEGMNAPQKEMAAVTNQGGVRGSLQDAIQGADVFIGVSAPNLLTAKDIQTMAKDAVVFAMANPEPEIYPDEAKKGGAAVVGTGRSDFPNQINNVLVFPGIFRGALDVRASKINEEMKIAAAYAIAGLIPEEKLSPGYIIPAPLDPLVAPAVAEAVRKAALETGAAK